MMGMLRGEKWNLVRVRTVDENQISPDELRAMSVCVSAGLDVEERWGKGEALLGIFT